VFKSLDGRIWSSDWTGSGDSIGAVTQLIDGRYAAVTSAGGVLIH
jgi:isoaspartyl peptidase/L-asparaginase-like protein (Ntn-hydrolase superfamily)